MHWSTNLVGNGSFSFEEAVVLGRRTSLTVPIKGEIVLKAGVWIGDDCDISATESILVGQHTSLQNRSIILGDVTIGAGCLCGPNLYISSSWHHFDDIPALPIRWQDAQVFSKDLDPNQSRPVLIGEDCWIGINVVVTPGVKIGRGCVVGANAVVTKHLPPYSVAVGVPAKVIRKRLDFSPPRNLDARLSEHIPYFYSGFMQWNDCVPNFERAVCSDGWCAEGSFTLAMNAENGVLISLNVRAAAHGEMRHGSQMVKVLAGESVLSFKVELSDVGLLDFRWLSGDLQNGAVIAVVTVSQINDGN